MLKKIYPFIILLIGLQFSAKAQQDSISKIQENTNKWGIKFGGFINSQVFWDTRQSVSARETMLLLYPKDISKDADGNDINAVPSMNQLAIISRLSGIITGPDVLGAKFKGLLEADFSGQSDGSINLFRLRHAYVSFNWIHSELLIGQTWHPMNVQEMMPGLSLLNNGAPFHPFSRHVQVRYAYRVGDFHFMAVAASQRDNSSSGPEGGSPTYLLNSAIPNFDLQVQYRKGKHFAGVGADFKVIQPRLSYEYNGSTYKQTEMLPSLAAIAFWNYKFSEWDLKVEAIWGQNQYEHLMIGGYAESVFDTINHTVSYTNLEQVSAWFEFSRTKGTWRPGIFAGYTQNLGFQNNFTTNAKTYARGADIASVWRIVPRLSFFASDKLSFTSEIEYTSVAYGMLDKKNGKVNNSKEVGMFRFLLDVTYRF